MRAFLLSLWPALLAVLWTPAFAALPDVRIETGRFVLKNGMEGLVIVNRKIPAVSHAVWYRVGAMDEVSGKSGIAHFLEHLMFKGTEAFPKGELSRVVAGSGGYDNAFTMHEATGYYQYVPKDMLETVMKIEADRMRGISFDAKEVETERKVVLEERLMRTDNIPESALWEQMQFGLFANHPYRRPVIGWAEEIKGLAVSDLQDFYARYYAPSGAVLVIAGDIGVEEARQLAERHYGALPSLPTPERPTPLAEPDIRPIGVRFSVRDPNTDVAKWTRVYRVAPYREEAPGKAYALEVVEEILGGSKDSPLYAEFVRKKRLATDVSVSYSPVSRGDALFTLEATIADGQTPDRFEAHLDAFLQTGPDAWLTDEALADAKERLEAGRIFASEDLRGMAFIYGKSLTVTGSTSYLDRWLDGVRTVSLAEARAAFLEFRDKARHATGVALPGRGGV